MLLKVFINLVIKFKVVWILVKEYMLIGECKYFCGMFKVIVGMLLILYCKIVLLVLLFLVMYL